MAQVPLLAAGIGGAVKRFLLTLGFVVSAYAAVVAAIGLTARARHADLAIVFGNTVAPDGTPSKRLVARLSTAAALYRAHVVPAILVSGAVGREEVNEAMVMRAELVRRGVPMEAIVVDPEGVNTRLTCLHARAVLEDRGGTRVVLVTQWFHVARAELAARRAGLAGVSAQAPLWGEPRDAYSFLRELVALPAYAFRPGSTRLGGGA
jgi:vancomycin permeability regulator SanA